MEKIKLTNQEYYDKFKITPKLSLATKDNPVIAWWSGGIDSAIVCHLCIKHFGKDYVRLVFINTKNEDEDTIRFMQDCEKWYDKKIETITHHEYADIKEVWRDFQSLNVATGAICSSTLKREVRIKFGRENKFSYQAFGFDNKEVKRAAGMLKNYYFIKPVFPLLEAGYDKQTCLTILNNADVRIPRVYGYGFNNNNCFRTGCVQGGIGYWQKMQKDFPDKFDAMADMEHELTGEKGEPVTMLKDQSNAAKKRNDGSGELIFLKPHPKYPNMKHIGQMKGRKIEPLKECNGFCNKDDKH